MSDPNSREAGVSPGAEGPADEYFTSQNYESWDIIDYLAQFGNLDSKDRLLNSWWKSLHWRRQGTSPAASKADDLIRGKDQDKVRARDFFSTRKHPGVGKVTIQNLSNINRSSFSINTTPGLDSSGLDTPTTTTRP